jgi:hypothetical protein
MDRMKHICFKYSKYRYRYIKKQNKIFLNKYFPTLELLPQKWWDVVKTTHVMNCWSEKQQQPRTLGIHQVSVGKKTTANQSKKCTPNYSNTVKHSKSSRYRYLKSLHSVQILRRGQWVFFLTNQLTNSVNNLVQKIPTYGTGICLKLLIKSKIIFYGTVYQVLVPVFFK